MATEADMTMTQTGIDAFNASLKEVLPSLRGYALSLTRDRDRAENLVQQTSMKALAGREMFRPGTNFEAWIFRIQRNAFISELRRTRSTLQIANAGAWLSIPPTQESGLVMREFIVAFRQLPRDSRQALLLSRFEGQPYEQIASHTGVAVGTVKSRISRARATLEQLLADKVVGDNRGCRVSATLSARSRATNTLKKLSGSGRLFDGHGQVPAHAASRPSPSSISSRGAEA
jgi:RNA polymerase sigma-70 factor (ECF subfamily)